MTILAGFEDEDEQVKGKDVRLKKSLYGLKQSPRSWFGRFTKVLKGHGYTQGQVDHTFFVKISKDDISFFI